MLLNVSGIFVYNAVLYYKSTNLGRLLLWCGPARNNMPDSAPAALDASGHNLQKQNLRITSDQTFNLCMKQVTFSCLFKQTHTQIHAPAAHVTSVLWKQQLGLMFKLAFRRCVFFQTGRLHAEGDYNIAGNGRAVSCTSLKIMGRWKKLHIGESSSKSD